MKTTNFVILCTVFLSTLFSILLYNQFKMIKSDELFTRYNEVVDNATEDASKALIDNYDSSSLEISADANNYQAVNLNLEKALWRFYKTLYLNLNIENDYTEQQALMDKIPIKLAVGYDGYFINSWTEQTTSSGARKLLQSWGNKIDYSMLDKKNNLQINFTLDDYVYVTDLNTKATSEGKQSSFVSKYPNSIFSTDNIKFDGVRRQVITNLIDNDLKYYTSYSNEISEKYGFGYKFTLPYIGDTAIDNVSFIAFIQGVPLKGTQQVYNSYSLGVARTVKKNNWYGYTVNGTKYYHNSNYSKTGDNPVIFDSAMQAAEAGYYPDPQCKNSGTSTVTGSGTKQVNFASSINQSQSQTITIPNLSKIDSITTDNGNVNYTTNGDNVTINVSNGTATSVLNNQKSSINANNSLTNSTNIFPDTNPYSDSNGNTGILSKNGSSVVSSGSYTPASNKTVTATSANYTDASQVPPTYSYSDSNGYSGLLWETGLIVNSTGSQLASSKTVSASSGIYSSSYLVPPTYAYSDANGYSGILPGTGIIKTQTGGSYTSGGSDTATASSASYSSPSLVPSTYAYDNDGYSGILNGTGITSSTVQTGGSYTPASSKYVTASQGVFMYVYWNYTNGVEVSLASTAFNPSNYSSYNYNSGGYSGVLSRTGELSDVWTYQTYPSTFNGVGLYATENAGISYSGTVTKPGSDTRTYTTTYSENYNGVVTSPAVDTRTYSYSENYLGTVTNSSAGNASSEYSENYSGIVTKPASDTRQYTQNYSGTAYKSETDNYYGYNVTINYEYETDPSK